MIPTELFRRLGGFDDRFAPCYYEDTDLAFQVRQAGLKVYYQPFCRVIHVEGIVHGTDLERGGKVHQRVNQKRFREKWSEVLASHRPSPLPEDRENEPHRRTVGRVLVVDGWIPTPDQDAGSLRMFNLLTILRNLSLSVTFIPGNLARVEPYASRLERGGIQVMCHPQIESVADYLMQYGRALDVVILSRADVATNLLELVRAFAPQAKLIFDTVDLCFLREGREAELMQDPALIRRAEDRKKQELSLSRRSDYVLVVSDAERELLDRVGQGLNVHIVTTIHPVARTPKGFHDRSGLLFIGGFNHPPNVDAVHYFVKSVWPLVRAELPGVVFEILGSHPPESVRRLAGAGIAVRGYVADVTPYFNDCRVSVAPLRYGAGVKGKVNQSLSHGLPAVISTIAAEGMGLADGHDVLIADSPVDFARAIVRLYTSPELWSKLAENGLRTTQERYSFEAVTRSVKRLLFDGPAAALRAPHLPRAVRAARVA
jgi:glycosyltransferase involved in cell wall biosynthesis